MLFGSFWHAVRRLPFGYASFFITKTAEKASQISSKIFIEIGSKAFG
jgi:hypothetical protein